MEAKKWYESKTLWVNAVGIAAIVTQTQTGFVIDAENQAAILGVINIILRAMTKVPVGK